MVHVLDSWTISCDSWSKTEAAAPAVAPAVILQQTVASILQFWRGLASVLHLWRGLKLQDALVVARVQGGGGKAAF